MSNSTPPTKRDIFFRPIGAGLRIRPILVDKINMPAPKKLIKQELSNDKLITVK